MAVMDMMVKVKEIITKMRNGLVTHGGVFHADDVFATALLLIIWKILCPEEDEPEIRRVFKVNDDEEGLVYDIGNGEFDHHSEPKEYRENGIPYAAFGKLWRVIGSEVFGVKFTKILDDNLVSLIDNQDNGGDHNPLSQAISDFNPSWDDSATTDECFTDAVAFAKDILQRKIDRYESTKAAEDIICEAAEERTDNRILVLETYVPYLSKVQADYPEICFVIYPSLRGGWNCNTVPEPGEKQGKVLFPTEWLGKINSELGITFCHVGNFLLSTNTKEQAVKCAKIALGEEVYENPSEMKVVYKDERFFDSEDNIVIKDYHGNKRIEELDMQTVVAIRIIESAGNRKAIITDLHGNEEWKDLSDNMGTLDTSIHSKLIYLAFPTNI